MVEKGMEETRLEAEGRLQRRRIALVVVALLGLSVAFVGGVVVGVKLERSRRPVEISQRFPVPPPVAPEAEEKEEVPITFYERLTREAPPVPKAEEGLREEKPPEGTKAEIPKEAPKEAEAPKAPPEEAKKEVSFFIQVASFRSKDNAQALLRRLRAKGYGAKIVPVRLQGALWYRVRIEGLKEKEALRVKAELEREGFKGLKVKREG
ncbi:MAG: hypothetical protein DRG69_04705 [Deltaproteobacteria bacterium]|nr:MAG: hypothetical protein DRG69_04705 [Deltaproteobacteria bacterium]